MTDTNERAVIGNNACPCPFAAHEANALDLIDLASGCLTGEAIDSQAKADAISELLDNIKDAAKALEETRKAEKAPWDAGAKAVQALATPLAAKLETAKKTAQSALTPWLVAQQAIRDAAAQVKRDEADRLQKEALAAFQASDVADLDARLVADELANAAKKANAAANWIDKSATGLRTSWHGTVTDYGKAIAWLKHTRPADLKAAIDELVRKEVVSGQRTITGVDIVEVKKAI